jgi:uncharacterized protein YraI
MNYVLNWFPLKSSATNTQQSEAWPMYRRHLVSSFAVLLLAVCGTAGAQNAYTARQMNLHAGPDRDYPLITQVDEGTPLEVHGCLDGWSWCDVSVEGNRGWMYGGGIYFDYNGGTVWLYSYGPQVGVPVITFSVDTYWGQYYQGRPWYGQRETWAHRRFARPARLARPSGQPPQHGGHGPAPRGQPSPRPMTHSRPSATEHSGSQMRSAAPSEGRGPPKSTHTQRPKTPPPSSHAKEHGSTDKEHSEKKPNNPP